MSHINLLFLLDSQWKIRRPRPANKDGNWEGQNGGDFFEFISDPSLRQIYRMVFERVKSEQREICLPLRCDTPNLRREAYVRIRPVNVEGGDYLEVENGTLSETPRPSVPLLDPHTARDETFLSICSWCKRVKVNDTEWVEVEDAIHRLKLFGRPTLPRLTHGMCPTCYHDLMASVTARAPRP